MVNIDVGNIYITSGTVSGNTITGGTTVDIQTTKIDQNMDNQVTILPIPISRGSRSSKTAYARAIDLKRIKEVVSVQGFLIDEPPSRAIDKKNNLLTLAKTGGALTLVWGQGNYQTLWKPSTSPYGVFILKIMFTETAGLIADASGFTGDPPPERSMAIQIQLVRGKDM